MGVKVDEAGNDPASVQVDAISGRVGGGGRPASGDVPVANPDFPARHRAVGGVDDLRVGEDEILRRRELGVDRTDREGGEDGNAHEVLSGRSDR